MNKFFVIIWITLLETHVYSKGRVVFLISDAPSELRIPLIEVYRLAHQEIVNRDLWAVVSQRNIASYTRYDRRLKFFGGIPFLDSEAMRRDLKRLQNHNKVIPPIHKLLDTYTLDGAILLSCDRTLKNRFSKCSFLYYDRREAKITASAHKKFLIPVEDPSRWAGILISQLARGIEVVAQREDKKRIDAFIRSPRTSPAKNQVLLGAGFQSERFQWQNDDISLPTARIKLGWVRSHRVFSLNIFEGKTSRKQKDRVSRWELAGLEFEFESFVNAMTQLKWGLGILGGQVTLGQRVGQSFELRSSHFGVRPYLGFALSKQLSFNLEYVFKYRMENAIRDLGKDSRGELMSAAHSVGLGMTYIL